MRTTSPPMSAAASAMARNRSSEGDPAMAVHASKETGQNGFRACRLGVPSASVVVLQLEQIDSPRCGLVPLTIAVRYGSQSRNVTGGTHKGASVARAAPWRPGLRVRL